MQLSKQQAQAVEAEAGLAPEPFVAPEPPTAEELDRERRRSRLKKLGGLLIPLALLATSRSPPTPWLSAGPSRSASCC